MQRCCIIVPLMNTGKTAYYLLIPVLLIFFTTIVHAQEIHRRDSVYMKIEDFSKRRKASKFLYRLIFRNTPDSAAVPERRKISAEDYQGKIIRNIYITSVDPLGYNSDMQKKDTRWYDDFGNRLHWKTRNFAVRGYLLFKKGSHFDVQKIYESERLLRNTSFINRVSILPVDSTSTKDSVDIAVRVLDSWSLRPSVEFSGKKFGIGLSEGNFLGMGHEISMLYRTDFSDKRNYTSAGYVANNIYGSYINAEILGEKDFDNNENVFFKAARDFYSPLTRWAGGINIDYFKRSIYIPVNLNDDDLPLATIKVHNQDFWGGYQFQLSRDNKEKITDNIGVSARFQNYIYLESPGEEIDPNNFFRSYNLFLASVGYTQRKFYVDRFVVRYNLPEDIPYGTSLSVTGGYIRMRQGSSYPYAALSAGYGFFSKAGYFNYKAEYGSFFREKKNYRSTFRFDGTYYSPLEDWKFAKARHFISHTLVIGSQRSPSYVDRINITAQDEFPPYDENYLGKNKLVLRYQLQLFVNKSWKNFHFNPYFITALGWLSQDEQQLLKTKTNTKFGLGVMIYNPYLAFNRFQLSFVFYPSVPFDNNSVFELNSYKNYYMPFNNFRIEEPNIVNYRN